MSALGQVVQSFGSYGFTAGLAVAGVAGATTGVVNVATVVFGAGGGFVVLGVAGVLAIAVAAAARPLDGAVLEVSVIGDAAEKARVCGTNPAESDPIKAGRVRAR